jgi:uncharacterized protein (DUF433 family)
MTALMMDSVVDVDPGILEGTPVFRGTRVPVWVLFDVLIGGGNVREFLEDYPGVGAEQVERVLELAREELLSGCVARIAG